MAAIRISRGTSDPFAKLNAPPAPSGVMAGFEQAIPGFGQISSTAASNIKNLLSGLPSVSQSRLDNAYFGAGSGLGGGSPFLANRGRALYGQRAEQNRQTGLQNFLQLMQSVGGNVVPNVGQTMQQNQFNQNLGFQQADASRMRDLEEDRLREQRRQFDLNYAARPGYYG